MQKIEIVKTVASFIVGAGTSRIVNGVIANNTATENVIDKIAVGSSSVVIGSMAGAATKDHTNNMIDGIVEAIQTIRESKS